MEKKRRVLWVDDDGKGRFQYELSVLEEYGLATDWAVDAGEAVSSLSKTGYDLVLLDQVFPIGQESSYKDVWSGCRLLYWLRGKQPPAGAPQGALWASLLRRNQPAEVNRSVSVIIISGFQDDHVDEALRQENQDIAIFPKPVDGDKLLARIENLLARVP